MIFNFKVCVENHRYIIFNILQERLELVVFFHYLWVILHALFQVIVGLSKHVDVFYQVQKPENNKSQDSHDVQNAYWLIIFDNLDCWVGILSVVLNQLWYLLIDVLWHWTVSHVIKKINESMIKMKVIEVNESAFKFRIHRQFLIAPYLWVFISGLGKRIISNFLEHDYKGQ